MDRKKYVIEASDDVKKIIVMGVTHGGAIWTDTTDIEILEELNSDYIKEHFGDLQDEAYKRGFEDGKDAINKGCEGCKYLDTPSTSPTCCICCNNFDNNWTAKKQDDEIKVGDEVTDIQSGANFLVTHLWESNHGDKGVSGFNNDCSAFSATLDKVSKTGRHFDINGILREMRE